MAFGTALRKSGLLQSVGRPASCWDNIVAESYFATFKKELICRHTSSYITTMVAAFLVG